MIFEYSRALQNRRHDSSSWKNTKEPLSFHVDYEFWKEKMKEFNVASFLWTLPFLTLLIVVPSVNAELTSSSLALSVSSRVMFHVLVGNRSTYWKQHKTTSLFFFVMGFERKTIYK